MLLCAACILRDFSLFAVSHELDLFSSTQPVRCWSHEWCTWGVKLGGDGRWAAWCMVSREMSEKGGGLFCSSSSLFTYCFWKWHCSVPMGFIFRTKTSLSYWALWSENGHAVGQCKSSASWARWWCTVHLCQEPQSRPHSNSPRYHPAGHFGWIGSTG